MALSTQHAAIDLGASSGRVVLGRVGPDSLELREVSRFSNGIVNMPDGLHWNLIGLYEHVLSGLSIALREGEEVASVAVDSWAVDYGLLAGPDPSRRMLLGAPFHYRDERAARGVDRVHEEIPFTELYRRNGLQFLPFNTLYQLAADQLLDHAQGLLLVPDLIGYWLTGNQLTEATNASTTGLVDVRTQSWDIDLIHRLHLDPGLFAQLASPGTVLGETRSQLSPQLGGHQVPVTLAGSHDTASAVVGTPLTSTNSAYISCGTWGLVGLELDSPVVTDASRDANFTNEGGVDGHTRFLTNVMGTWLLSEALRTWEGQQGKAQDLHRLLAAAAEVPIAAAPVFDVQDERFLPPGDMPARIHALCSEEGRAAPDGKPETVRSIVESIAAGFARAVNRAAQLSGRTIDVIHLVGGGSQNALLCQATADHSGLDVLAGPVEATAIGNLLVQARTAGTLQGELEDLRELVSRSQALVLYRPRR